MCSPCFFLLFTRRCRRTNTLSKLGWQALGGPGRDIEVLVEFQLSKVSYSLRSRFSSKLQFCGVTLSINVACVVFVFF